MIKLQHVPEFFVTMPLAKIKPAKRSYTGIARFLEDCEQDGLFSTLVDESGRDTGELASPFGYALLRLGRAARKAMADGKPYQEFELEFNAEIERDRQANQERVESQRKTLARALKERNGKKGDDLLDYGREKLA